MADDDGGRHLPEVRSDSSVPEKRSSRLLRRGLDALDIERSRCLRVVDIIAFEESTFIISNDENHETLADGDKNPLFGSRQIVLYEFSRRGELVGKLKLPLLHLEDDGYSLLRSTEPGKVNVRDGFIHFYETLYANQPAKWRRIRHQEASWWDSGTTVSYDFDLSVEGLRIDYLFSRTGTQLFVWADSTFPDHYRVESEPPVPCNLSLRPNWAIMDRLVEVVPSSRYCQHFVVERHVNELIATAKNVDSYLTGGGSAISYGSPAGAWPVSFPHSSTKSQDGRMQSAWGSSCSDATSIWFARRERSSDARDNYIWKLSFDEESPFVDRYLCWEPVAESWVQDSLFHFLKSHSSFREIENTAIEITGILAWEGTVLVQVHVIDEMNTEEVEEYITLNRIEDGELVATGKLLASAIDLQPADKVGRRREQSEGRLMHFASLGNGSTTDHVDLEAVMDFEWRG